MKRVLVMTLGTAALVAGILLFALSAARQAADPAIAVRGATQQRQEEPAAANGLEGEYRGEVKLGAVVPGAYVDPLITPTPQPAETPVPNLGDIELALFLRQSGGQVTGYVDLGVTLVFTREHTIQATPVGYATGPEVTPPVPTPLAVGPAVSGTFDGTTLSLVSERVSLATNTGLRLQRQFRLVGTLQPGDDVQFVGEYRETFWGYGPQPVTLIGTFRIGQSVLATPVAPATATPTATRPPVGGNKVYLPVILRGK